MGKMKELYTIAQETQIDDKQFAGTMNERLYDTRPRMRLFEQTLIVSGSTETYQQDFEQLAGQWNPTLKAWLIPAEHHLTLQSLPGVADLDVLWLDLRSRTLKPQLKPSLPHQK